MKRLTKTIKKSEVIKTLKKETLSSNGWFKENYLTGSYDLNCEVCAVGAVLRQISFETWARKFALDLAELGQRAVKYADDVDGTELEMTAVHLENKNYLAALSNYFESGKTAKQCVIFVEKYFPKQFKLTIEM